MHTLQLEIDDSIFDKFMGLLDILPKEKISVSNDFSTHTVTTEEAKLKVQKSINNMTDDSGFSIDDAFDQVLES